MCVLGKLDVEASAFQLPVHTVIVWLGRTSPQTVGHRLYDNISFEYGE